LFSHKLNSREHSDLVLKGYLKIKFDIPTTQLKEFDAAYREGKEIPFTYRTTVINTVITSIEISDDSNAETCKVFLGFARQ
jgi:hypothetical protein